MIQLNKNLFLSIWNEQWNWKGGKQYACIVNKDGSMVHNPSQFSKGCAIAEKRGLITTNHYEKFISPLGKAMLRLTQ